MIEHVVLAIKGLIIAVIIASLWVGWFELNPMQYILGTTRKGQREKHRFTLKYINLSKRLYQLFSKFIFVQNLCYRLKISMALTEEEAKVRAGRIVIIEAAVVTITLILSLIIFNSVLLSVIFTGMMFFLVLYGVYVNELKFIHELYKFIEQMIYTYSAVRCNIDLMFEKLLEKPSYLTPYIEQMYEHLKAATLKDSTVAIAEYQDIVASRYLSLIFNYLYLAKVKGDTEDLFAKNMTALQREIHAEYMKTKKIEDGVSFEWFWHIGVIIGIFICETYMKTLSSGQGFEYINRFLTGSSGYLIKIACSLTAVICFYIYLALIFRSNTILTSKRQISWEDRFLSKHKVLNRWLIKISKKPLLINKAVAKLQLLNEGQENVKSFYFKSIVMAIAVFISSTAIFTMDNVCQYLVLQQSIYVGVDKDLMNLALDTEPNKNAFIKRSLANDKRLLREFKINGIPEDIYDTAKNLNIDYGLYQELGIERVTEKWNLSNQFNILTLAIMILTITLLGLCLPFIHLQLSVRLKREATLNEEVVGLYTVIVLLINHPSANKEMLVEWLGQFSVIFKDRFQSCIDHLNKQSISQIDIGIDYPALNRIVEGLRMAESGLHLSDAFAGIEQRQRFQEDMRQIINEQVIKTRVGIANALSWISMGTTFILYIGMPMVFMIMDSIEQNM